MRAEIISGVAAVALGSVAAVAFAQNGPPGRSNSGAAAAMTGPSGRLTRAPPRLLADPGTVQLGCRDGHEWTARAVQLRRCRSSQRASGAVQTQALPRLPSGPPGRSNSGAAAAPTDRPGQYNSGAATAPNGPPGQYNSGAATSKKKTDSK